MPLKDNQNQQGTNVGKTSQYPANQGQTPGKNSFASGATSEFAQEDRVHARNRETESRSQQNKAEFASESQASRQNVNSTGGNLRSTYQNQNNRQNTTNSTRDTEFANESQASRQSVNKTGGNPGSTSENQVNRMNSKKSSSNTEFASDYNFGKDPDPEKNKRGNRSNNQNNDDPYYNIT